MQKVFIIGSGPIIIGQAAEFDYSGTQAIKALKEEGAEVILLNNNPATIMTDLDLVDWLYSEPMTLESCQKIIEKHRPDALVLGMGGQTALNLGMALYHKGIIHSYQLKILGTHPLDIERAEDRELFKQEMIALGEPVMASFSANTLDEALEAAEKIGYPVIVRPAYTLGGFGGGICADEKALRITALEGLQKSSVNQVLIEESIYGWKEIEYEMMRDGEDHAITVCNMENMDPVGVHTGDSIVVAPSQTLTDQQYQMLRQSALRIVKHLKIIGGCNVQYALSPHDNRYYVIEVNPRVSRSSALASKATGYAIARIAMLIGLGRSLDEILNPLTKKTMACHEPTLDYCVVKIPRWPYDKLISTQTELGTVMRATGEVMAIGVTFEESLLKAIRSLDLAHHDLFDPTMRKLSREKLIKKCENKAYNRLFALSELMRRGESMALLQSKTQIDLYFLNKIYRCVMIERDIENTDSLESLSKEELLTFMKMGFSIQSLAKLTQSSLEKTKTILENHNINRVYRCVDTCGGEFDADSNYLYSTYHGSDEVEVSSNKKIIVLGSGPIRIGQGVEFDYCSVKALTVLREMGYEAIMINNNPETVSTDYDLSDKLYFEPLTLEDVLSVVKKENPIGVLLQYGGQTAIKLAHGLQEQGVKIFGLNTNLIDQVEDRECFYTLLDTLKIPRAQGGMARTLNEVKALVARIGYPILARPSYVIGGQDMAILRSDEDVCTYLERFNKRYPNEFVLIDQYLDGVEFEVDALSDGESVWLPGIMEHLDCAGVHSGDSIALYPARLSNFHMDALYQTIKKVCKALNYQGVLNFQFVQFQGTFYLIEVNPRASRSLPFMAKVTKTPMIEWSVQLALGAKLKKLGIKAGILNPMPYVALKAPVFSLEKLAGIDALLGPNMLSTGESMFIGKTLEEAMDKLFISEGIDFENLKILLDLSEKQLKFYEDFVAKGLMRHQITVVKEGMVLGSNEPVAQWLSLNNINLVVSTKDFYDGLSEEGRHLRALTRNRGIPLMMSPDKFKFLLKHMTRFFPGTKLFTLSDKG